MSTFVNIRPQSIACIGECMVELSGQQFGTLRQSWGGDSYNTAVYLRRLLPDCFSVHYLTGLGWDSLSEALIQSWQNEGLETNGVVRVDSKVPGLYQISVDDQGERSFTYWRNDSAAKYAFDNLTISELVIKLNAFDWVYLSGISLAILTEQGRATLLSALDRYRQDGGRIIFDNNYRPILWASLTISQEVYTSILAICDVALLTLDDEFAHFSLGSVEAVLSQWACPEIVIKRGKEPCVIQLENTIATVEATTVDQVIDTTAAGDSFGAGYVAGRLMNRSVTDAAQLAHNLASTVIKFPGAIIPISATEHLTLGNIVC